jgi:hypothetical protein
VPSNASAIGTLSLPLAAGAANTSLDDTLVLGLLDYFAFWLNGSLNAKLANMQGQPPTAVPLGRRYPYNPERAFVRTAIPALYMWRDDGPDGTRYEQHTILRLRRVSVVRALYLFSEQVIPSGAVVMNGLRTAVDATLLAATEYGYRGDYGYGGSPLGTPIQQSLKFEGWQYLGSEGGIMWKLPGDVAVSPAPGKGGDGAVQRGFPAVRAAWEILELADLRDASDTQLDSTLATKLDGEDVEGAVRRVYGPLADES